MTSSIAAIHAGFKQLGIADDADQRALYTRVTGQSRLTLMSIDEKDAVVTELRRLGFAPAGRRPDGRQKLTGEFAGKLQALWIAAWNLGIARNRDDAALIAFVERQTGIEHANWLRFAADANKAVEGLKAWIAREGGVDWSVVEADPDFARAPGFKIAWAQWLRLGGSVHANSVRQFRQEAAAIAGKPFDAIDDAEWRTVMNAFGERIRSAKKVCA